jgi:hypothetical protein
VKGLSGLFREPGAFPDYPLLLLDGGRCYPLAILRIPNFAVPGIYVKVESQQRLVVGLPYMRAVAVEDFKISI